MNKLKVNVYTLMFFAYAIGTTLAGHSEIYAKLDYLMYTLENFEKEFNKVSSNRLNITNA